MIDFIKYEDQRIKAFQLKLSLTFVVFVAVLAIIVV